MNDLVKQLSGDSLPDNVEKINLSERLVSFDPKKHLFHINSGVNDFFSKKKKKPFSPLEAKKERNWSMVGIKPIAVSYDKVKALIEKGEPFETKGYIPNDEIYGDVLYNRTDELGYEIAMNHLNDIGGMLWQALHIKTVVYYDKDTKTHKFVSVMGGHCTVKSIMTMGAGEHIVSDIVFYGDKLTMEETRELAAILHHTDSDLRKNQNPVSRTVSGVSARVPAYVEVVKMLIDCNYQLKGQVIPKNGQKLWEISSLQELKNLKIEFGYDHTKKTCLLGQEIFPDLKKQLTIGLQVLAIVLKYSNLDDKKLKEYLRHWSQDKIMSNLFPNSKSNKNPYLPAYEFIKGANIWLKKMGYSKKYQTTRKTFVNRVPANKIEDVKL